jgi:hypothetical protein
MGKKTSSARTRPTGLEPGKMGRPPMDEADRRTWRISIVVNRSELDEIKAKADSVGETISVWGRKKLMKAPAK